MVAQDGQMVLKGSFGDFSISQLLNLINLAQRTGTLRIFGHEAVHVPPFVGMIRNYSNAEHGQQGEIYFREGWVLSAAVNDISPDLVGLLTQSGEINARQAVNIRERFNATSESRLAVMLIHAGFVKKEDVLSVVRKQTMNIIKDILYWDKDRFEFVEDLPDFVGEVLAPINLKDAISHTTRLEHQRKQLIAALPDLDRALQFHEVTADRLNELTLTAADWRVLGYVSPRNSIQQIAKACNLTHTEIRQIVLRMLEAGVIELIEREDTTPKPPAPQQENRRRKVETQVMQIIKAAAKSFNNE